MSAPRRVFIGTAGWSIPRQFAGAFPQDGSGLSRYATVFGATEINSTFYRRHRASTFERWRDTVPASFRFAVKIPQSITHETALASPRRALRDFFDDVAGLGEKLGPVLVQLPASFQFDRRRVGAFFRSLRALHEGAVVCEPRHESWYTKAASSVFVEHDVARVVADPPRPADAAEPGGAPSLLYFRWHGSPDRYWSAYEDDALSSLAHRVKRARCPVWVVFDNTASGAATGNALDLRNRLESVSAAHR